MGSDDARDGAAAALARLGTPKATVLPLTRKHDGRRLVLALFVIVAAQLMVVLDGTVRVL